MSKRKHSDEEQMERQSTSRPRVETGTSSGRMETGTSSGRMETGTSSGRMETETSSGRMETGTSSGRMETETSSGRMETGTSSSRMETETSSGRMETGTSSGQQQEISGEVTITVKDIKYDATKILGIGGSGTAVFRGSFGKRTHVAVKRILLHNRTHVEIEEKHLIELEHDNVIRYHHTEKDHIFYYIALELAEGTVHDYVKYRTGDDMAKERFEGLEIDNNTILWQASKGLHWLHSKDIVHRDIKPSNILLVKNQKGEVVTKLADFGLSKNISGSQVRMTTGVGTQCWRAPEVTARSAEGRLKAPPASDIFSMGCLFYYVLSKGGHPFGSFEDQEENIKKGIYSLSAVEDQDILSRSLVEEMIQHDPVQRPSAEYVAKHPSFWLAEKTTKFIEDVSNRVQDGKDEELEKYLNKRSCLVLGGTENEPKNWKEKVEEYGYKTDRASKNKFATLGGLVQFFRNRRSHILEKPQQTTNVAGVEECTEEVGVSTRIEKLKKDINVIFPDLVLHTWLAASLRSKEVLQDYYTTDFEYRTTSKRGSNDEDQTGWPPTSRPRVETVTSSGIMETGTSSGRMETGTSSGRMETGTSSSRMETEISSGQQQEDSFEWDAEVGAEMAALRNVSSVFMSPISCSAVERMASSLPELCPQYVPPAVCNRESCDALHVCRLYVRLPCSMMRENFLLRRLRQTRHSTSRQPAADPSTSQTSAAGLTTSRSSAAVPSTSQTSAAVPSTSRQPAADPSTSQTSAADLTTSRQPAAVRSTSRTSADRRFTPCNQRVCRMCKSGQKGCRKTDTVYQLTCVSCGQKYVGESSQPLRKVYSKHMHNLYMEGLRDGSAQVSRPLQRHLQYHRMKGDESTPDFLQIEIRMLTKESNNKKRWKEKKNWISLLKPEMNNSC